MNKKHIITILSLLFSVVIKAYDFQVDGIYYLIESMPENTVLITHGENKYSGNIKIPQTVNFQNRTFRTIGIVDGAFSNCNISSISLPNDIRIICKGAFRNCINLKDIKLPDSLVYIGAAAFKNCGLESLVLPNNLHVVGDSAFADCSSLKSIILGPVVGGGYETRIYIPEFKKEYQQKLLSSVFANCKNVEKLFIKDSDFILETQFDSKPEPGKRGLGARTYPFIYDFVNLKELYVGRFLQGPDGRANLKYLVNLEHLEFSKYAKLEPISSDLKTLKIYRKMPKKVDRTDYFTTKTKMNATLYVPKGSAKYYKEAEMWKEFWNIVEMEN